jgi:hypothetical protein
LIDFLDGYSGPAEVPYHGGDISIVAVLLYRDGIRVDWRVGTMPDLSWISSEEEALGGSVPSAHIDRPRDIEVILQSRRLSDLWGQSTLVDDRGNQHQQPGRGSMWHNGSSWEGKSSFLLSAPPLDMRSLIIRLPDQDITIPLDVDVRRRDSETSSEFRAGYPGPSARFDFHGGSLKVISTLLYQKRVVVELLSRPLPDLPWVEVDEAKLSETINKLVDGERYRASFRAHRRLYKLMTEAGLTDDQHTAYLNEYAEGSSVPEGYQGEIAFSPGPPSHTSGLNLSLGEVRLSIALTG